MICAYDDCDRSLRRDNRRGYCRRHRYVFQDMQRSTDPAARSRYNAYQRKYKRRRYATDADYRAQVAERNRHRYATNADFRAREQAKARERYHQRRRAQQEAST